MVRQLLPIPIVPTYCPHILYMPSIRTHFAYLLTVPISRPYQPNLLDIPTLLTFLNVPIMGTYYTLTLLATRNDFT